MAVRTVEELEDSLYGALGWRRIELHSLLSALVTAERQAPRSPLSRALARSSATLIYAHWEGFVRESVQAYVDFLSRRRLKYGELNDDLLRTALAALARRLIAGDEAGISTLINTVRRPDQSRWLMQRTTMVNTKSNLRYSVLCEVLKNAGLSTEQFVLQSNFIDHSLCDVRNEIAHGREQFPDVDTVHAMHSRVLAMMETVRDLILKAARGQEYKISTTEEKVSAS